MKFSVVIALYNKAPYIENTLASVRNQGFQDFEIIVVDDGSTDGGAARVQAIGDTRIRLLQQANAGVSAARNHAIAVAQGEWVAFLDADDWWHPDYLQAQWNTIQAYPGRDMVATALLALPDAPDWNPVAWPVPALDGGREEITDLPRRWMGGHPFFTGSVAVRGALLKSMQPCFAVGEHDGEDLDLWLRIAEKSAVVWCPVPLVAYRSAVEGSLSTQHRFEHMPPFLARLAQRARSGQLDAARSRSALVFIAQQQITFARRKLMAGRRRRAFRWIAASARDGLALKRWWLTLFMAVAVPAAGIRRWQDAKKRQLHASARKALPDAPLPVSGAPAPISTLAQPQQHQAR